MHKDLQLENKKILLAAGDSAINKAIASKLLESGAVLYIIGTLVIDNSIYKINKIACDIGDVENLEPTLNSFLSLHKPFDGFVFAGGKGGVRPLSLTKPEFLHDMMKENLYSFVELIRLSTKKGLMNEGSSIVALSSVSSIKGLKSKIAYSASKAAVDGAVRSMAAELASRRIRANSIQKAWVSSDMNLDFIETNRSITDTDDFHKQILGAIEPHEIANAVVFLLSDYSRSITGTALVLDGGYTI